MSTLTECIGALSANPIAVNSDLYVVSDAASRPEHEEAVRSVRKFVEGITGFRSVRLLANSKNLGGFLSITKAESEIVAEHGRIIVLEDDVVSSPGFLEFMNAGLNALASRSDVFSICGYVPEPARRYGVANSAMPARLHCPWGYATWRDRLHIIDAHRNPYREVVRHPEIIKLITENCPFMLEVLREDYFEDHGCADVRISFQMLLAGMISVYPPASLTRNIGLDGSGQRMKENQALMQQEIVESADVKNWRLSNHEDFERQILRNGRIRPQRLISAIYQIGMRDELDWLVRLARRLRA